MSDQQPNCGAIPLPAMNALLKYFQETPMPHNVSNPFIQVLSQASLVYVEQASASPLRPGSKDGTVD